MQPKPVPSPEDAEDSMNRKGDDYVPKITLKAARVNIGLTQEEAATALGVSRSTLRSWESGKSYPKQPQIIAICELYKVSFDALYFGNGLTLS